MAYLGYRTVLLSLMCLYPSIVLSQLAKDGVGEFYSSGLVEKYGDSSKINSVQLQELMAAIQKLSQSLVQDSSGHSTSSGHGNPPTGTVPSTQSGICTGFSDITCLKTQCLDSTNLLRLYGLQPKEGATQSEMIQMSPALIYQLQNPECYHRVQTNATTNIKKKTKPTATEVWGYGFLSVTIINISACLGILFYPIMKTPLYQKLLMCMVGLAVGTLSASAILVLIPETFELMSEESHLKDVYIWRALVVIGGIYLFFTIERLLNSILAFQKSRKLKKEQRGVGPVEPKSYFNAGYEPEREIAAGEIEKPEKIENGHSGHGHSHGGDLPVTDKKPSMHWAPLSSIKSVAWMIIFGDAIHNFVDGLSIGAAFSENTLAGVSLSLAILCEELPHELGDFAVLLASGMGVLQAMLMNFLSALSCYVGLVIGIQVGALEQGALWIFAIAGGMFLYISLVDMLPEMNEQARLVEERGGSKCMVYLLQNLGLVLGWLIILLVSLYGGNINFG